MSKSNNGMAKMIAVCRSEKKGTKKGGVTEGVLREDYSLIVDVGCWT